MVVLKLKNIKLNGSIMSCDYYPEDTDYKGFIAYDMEKDKMVDYVPSEYHCNEKMYTGQTVAKLYNLYKNKNDIPNEAYSVWY